ncbi:homocysteine S-methyltransferase YbgG [Syngnathus scovelli]|uniref:homocysteine S-methyltransferase YbgG n=1 Tax=Syngnathus scovelli TaxID=161590 RepID=UPI0021105B14|nr:homocysteine S-methyltransferase YbgG [Syngnathus scovelli]
MNLRARLRDDNERVLLLDGGLATELEAQGAHLQGDPLWSSRLLHTNPQAIKAAHHSFLLNGADVITTATYQASIQGFIQHLGVSSDTARELMASGLHLAVDAAMTFGSGKRARAVAASMGPYGAFLCDGSEYSGKYADKMSVEDLKAWHRPQLECLAAAGADVLALETIPSIKEAEALAELLREFPNCNAWISFSCKDGAHLSDGTPLQDGVRLASRSTQVLAIGVNCCPPELVEPLLDSVAALRGPDLKWVVYPNSGEDWDAQQGWHSSGKTSATLPALSDTWIKQGAALIGGCCRIRPEQIGELRRHLHPMEKEADLDI